MSILSKIEHALFGASAEEMAEMRLKYIERRIDQRLEQIFTRALEDDPDDPDEDAAMAAAEDTRG